MLSLLVHRRYLRYDAERGRFSPGIRLFDLGSIVLDQMGLRRIALPVMRRLRDETDESVSVNVVDGDWRVCIEKVETDHDVRQIISIGRRSPLYAGASGKCLLAYLPDAEAEAVLARIELRPIATRTITDLGQLRRELRRVRDRGYATSANERVDGAAAIAAPVLDHTGSVIAALTVSGPEPRFRNRMTEFAERTVRAAADISAELGYRGSSARMIG